MTDICVSEERDIAIPAEQAYACLADYANHHRNILPPAFSDYEVERGGQGAGTVVRFTLRAGGTPRRYRMEVSEPDPGRILVETDPEQRTQTTFTVTPIPAGCVVRIETCWEVINPIRGFFERILVPLFLKDLYRDEIRRLEAYARELEIDSATTADPQLQDTPTRTSPRTQARSDA